MNTQIYNNIFDAFRLFDPQNKLIQLENDIPCFFKRTNRYELIDMEDGYYGAFPDFPTTTLYRGEYKDYGNSRASIYRSDDPDDVVIDELKIIEFKNILATFPQVQYAIEDNMCVDYLALAQHYGLNTKLIDVTSLPEIAAYFATHKWIDGVATPVEDGVGCIHGISTPFLVPSKYVNDQICAHKFHRIGLQCFQRPGIQAAYGIELDKDEDLRDKGWTIYFKQTAKASRLIHMNFHIDEQKVGDASRRVTKDSNEKITSLNSWLFPEEDIADVAEIVKKVKWISLNTVQEYGIDKCKDALKRKGVKVIDRSVYVLDEKKKKELAEKYKDRPYGDVQLNTRLVFIPPTN